MQKPIFPMKYINITQKWGSGTHTYGYPIDNAGKNAGIDDVYAPFDAVVKKIWKNGNTVWIESQSKVQYSDGKKEYATMSFTHDNNVSNLKVGQKIKQGKVFYQEGTAGYATGNHVHIECARGKFTGTGWYQASNGQWVINNPYPPDKMLVKTSNNIVVNAQGIIFKEDSMISKMIANCIRRFYTGKDCTAEELKKYVGRVTPDEFRKAVMSWPSFKNDIERAKNGTLNPADHMPATLRKVYKSPAQIKATTLKKGLYKVG